MGQRDRSLLTEEAGAIVNPQTPPRPLFQVRFSPSAHDAELTSAAGTSQRGRDHRPMGPGSILTYLFSSLPPAEVSRSPRIGSP